MTRKLLKHTSLHAMADTDFTDAYMGDFQSWWPQWGILRLFSRRKRS